MEKPCTECGRLTDSDPDYCWPGKCAGCSNKGPNKDARISALESALATMTSELDAEVRRARTAEAECERLREERDDARRMICLRDVKDEERLSADMYPPTTPQTTFKIAANERMVISRRARRPRGGGGVREMEIRYKPTADNDLLQIVDGEEVGTLGVRLAPDTADLFARAPLLEIENADLRAKLCTYMGLAAVAEHDRDDARGERDRASQEVQRLRSGIKSAMDYAAHRWSEWGSRALCVAEILDAAMENREPELD